MSHEHRQHPERYYDDEGEECEPFEWFDRPGKPAPGDEAQSWEVDPYGRPWATAEEIDAAVPDTEWNP